MEVFHHWIVQSVLFHSLQVPGGPGDPVIPCQWKCKIFKTMQAPYSRQRVVAPRSVVWHPPNALRGPQNHHSPAEVLKDRIMRHREDRYFLKHSDVWLSGTVSQKSPEIPNRRLQGKLTKISCGFACFCRTNIDTTFKIQDVLCSFFR